jgi:hypothetical protein
MLRGAWGTLLTRSSRVQIPSEWLVMHLAISPAVLIQLEHAAFLISTSVWCFDFAIRGCAEAALQQQQIFAVERRRRYPNVGVTLLNARPQGFSQHQSGQV